MENKFVFLGMALGSIIALAAALFRKIIPSPPTVPIQEQVLNKKAEERVEQIQEDPQQASSALKNARKGRR